MLQQRVGRIWTLALLTLLSTAGSGPASAVVMPLWTLAWDGTSQAVITVQVYNDPTAIGSDTLNGVSLSVAGPNGESVPSAVVSPSSLNIATGSTGQFTVTISSSDLGSLSALGGLVLSTNMTNTDVFETVPSIDFVEIPAASGNAAAPMLSLPFTLTLVVLLLGTAIAFRGRAPKRTIALFALATCSLWALPPLVGDAATVLSISKKFNIIGPAPVANACTAAAQNTGVAVTLRAQILKPAGKYGATFRYVPSVANLFTGVRVQEVVGNINGCGFNNVVPKVAGVIVPVGTLVDRIATSGIAANVAVPCTVANTQQLQCYEPVGKKWITFANNNHAQNVSAPPPAQQTITTVVTNTDIPSSDMGTQNFP